MKQLLIPKGWTKDSLGNCVEILDHKRVPINAYQRKQKVGHVPYYGATGRVGWTNDYLFNEELVLLGEDGAPFLKAFKNKAYLISGKSWVNNHAHVLKGIKGVVLNNFLCHYLNWFDYQQFVTGTTRLKLNQTSMKSIPVLLPPISEQKQIAFKIESLFLKIGEVKQSLETTLTLLEQHRQSILNHAFKRSFKQCVPSKQLKHSKEWANTYLGQLVQPSKERFDPVTSKNTTFIGLEHIESNTGRILQPGESKSTKSLKTIFRAGDILYGRLRPYLNKVCVPNFDGVCSTDILVFPTKPSISNKYIALFLLTPNFVAYANKNATGVQHPRVSFKKLEEFQIPLPPLSEQRYIASKIESVFSKTDSIRQSLKTTLFLLERHRRSVLNYAFEGKTSIALSAGFLVGEGSQHAKDHTKASSLRQCETRR